MKSHFEKRSNTAVPLTINLIYYAYYFQVNIWRSKESLLRIYYALHLKRKIQLRTNVSYTKIHTYIHIHGHIFKPYTYRNTYTITATINYGCWIAFTHTMSSASYYCYSSSWHKWHITAIILQYYLSIW